MQCINCKNRFVIRPLPDESYTFCYSTETVDNIDFGEELSPTIKKFWNGKIPCQKFKRGRSMSEPPVDNPFGVPIERISAEKIVLRKMNLI
ncbi:hypothetical protein HZB04_02855 [Candidatus Wolfebacteria bacterium]|nr:hypothetical protein [Candidatus Wolfebacteria bacterium]